VELISEVQWGDDSCGLLLLRLLNFRKWIMLD